MRKLLPLGVFILLIPTAVFAGNVDTFGIGSRATALGGAVSASLKTPFAVYYNPAGLALLNGTQVSAGFEWLNPDLKISNFKAVDYAGRVLSSSKIKDTSPPLFVPAVALSKKINNKWAFGIGSYVPYGLHIRWDSDPLKNPAAYNGFESYYIREVVNPTVSYAFNKKVYFGFGLDLGRSYAGTQRRIYAPDVPSLNNKVIKSDLKDSFNISFNTGVLYIPNDKVSFGLTYRSRAKTNFKGTVEVEGVQKVDATTKIDHPEQLQMGVHLKPFENWNIEMDVVWTNWSIIKGYTVNFEQPLLGKNSEYFKRDWRDTRQLRIGVEWKATKNLTVRGGYFYDPSPIPDTTFDMLWPDADKKTYSLGIGYKRGNFSIDLVAQYAVAEYKRYIGGESVLLNDSYSSSNGTGRVSLEAGGSLLGLGMTANYRF